MSDIIDLEMQDIINSWANQLAAKAAEVALLEGKVAAFLRLLEPTEEVSEDAASEA